MKVITTDKGYKYYWYDSTPNRQEIIEVEKYDGAFFNARDIRTFDCTPDELLPLMNKYGF